MTDWNKWVSDVREFANKPSLTEPPLTPPLTPPFFRFSADKWDDYLARNALLHFIHQKGLDEELENFLKQHWPSHEDEEAD